MAGAEFHSIAKPRALIFRPVMADRGEFYADCSTKMALLLIAKLIQI
jgi:hypothetical protein